jgi:hypothetical protein
MEHEVAAVDRTVRDREIGQVAFEKIHAGYMIEIRASARNQIIDNPDVVTAANEFLREVRPDEAGTAGDEIVSHAAANPSNIRASHTETA